MKVRFAGYLRELARQPEGPPSPMAMDNLVTQLIWDGEIDRAYEAADDMVNHFLHRDDRGWQRDHGFSIWLGIRSTIQTFCGVRNVEREHRARMRTKKSTRATRANKPDVRPVSNPSIGGGQ